MGPEVCKGWLGKKNTLPAGIPKRTAFLSHPVVANSRFFPFLCAPSFSFFRLNQSLFKQDLDIDDPDNPDLPAIPLPGDSPPRPVIAYQKKKQGKGILNT